MSHAEVVDGGDVEVKFEVQACESGVALVRLNTSADQRLHLPLALSSTCLGV